MIQNSLLTNQAMKPFARSDAAITLPDGWLVLVLGRGRYGIHSKATLKKKWFPVQRVAEIMASRAAANSFFFPFFFVLFFLVRK